MIEKLEPPEGYVFICVHCAEEIAIKLEDVGEVATNEAYELADELDRVLQVSGCDNRVPRMLRKQADRIAELEKKLQESAMHNISITSQADEHYARVQELEKQIKRCDPICRPSVCNCMKRKPLTDEEIEQCFADACTDFKLLENGKTKGIVNIIDVGRAILRKAQEK